jgi:hypothetical protein
LHALKSGYRLIDCAYCYGNEEEVGQGLAEAFASGVCKREDVFVVSKVWATYTTRCELGLDKSLEKLGLGWVDLFLVVCSFFLFSCFVCFWGLGVGGRGGEGSLRDGRMGVERMGG